MISPSLFTQARELVFFLLEIPIDRLAVCEIERHRPEDLL
jgi:hypothetical protein